MNGWLIAALVAVVIVLVLRALVARLPYVKMFAGPHLAEVARGMVRAREAALAAVVVGEAPEEEPARAMERGAAFATSSGLAVMYTVEAKGAEGGAEPEAFEHHLSMSLRGARASRAALATLAVYVRRVAGLHGPASAGEGDGGVVHVVTRLTPAAHADLVAAAQASTDAPDEAACKRLFAESLGSDERARTLAALGAPTGPG